MISEPRTIARIVELFHIPIQHSPEVLRDVYLAVSSSCGYDNFLRIPGGARLESAAPEGGGGVSRVTFNKDRIIFSEEHRNTSLENFSRRIDEVVSVASEKLSVPIFIVRNHILRVVVSVPKGQHSSQFLSENLFRLQQEDLEELGRPGQIIGMRFLFPARDHSQGTHQVRIESYLRDRRSLFIEDSATFKFPIQSRDRERLSVELRDVEEFVHERVSAFLNRFPRR
ncbi:MAG: hypothetical protein V3T77_03230 [Planctomycetota bacterium]